MARTNIFPYIRLKTYHNISDDEIERCTFSDLEILNRRDAINQKPEANYHQDAGRFLSIEREEIANTFSYEELVEIATESFRHEDHFKRMASWIQSYVKFLHAKRKHEQWILDGKYDDKPEEKLIVDKMLEQDAATIIKLGVYDPEGKYPALTKSHDEEYENHKQWRDWHITERPNNPTEFPPCIYIKNKNN